MFHYHALIENKTDVITKCNNYLITKCDKSLLQNASGFLIQNPTVLLQFATVIKNGPILLQNATVITNCRVHYKICWYTGVLTPLLYWWNQIYWVIRGFNWSTSSWDPYHFSFYFHLIYFELVLVSFLVSFVLLGSVFISFLHFVESSHNIPLVQFLNTAWTHE